MQDPTQLPSREQRTQRRPQPRTANEALCHEVSVQGVTTRRNQGLGPKSQVKEYGINGWSGPEGRSRDARKHSDTPSRVQQTSHECEASLAVHDEPLGSLLLNDEVGVHRRIETARELCDNISRDIEWQARADFVAAARKLAAQKVRVDERYVRGITERPFKGAEHVRIDLVGRDVPTALGQWSGERPSPGPDFEDQVVGRD